MSCRIHTRSWGAWIRISCAHTSPWSASPPSRRPHGNSATPSPRCPSTSPRWSRTSGTPADPAPRGTDGGGRTAPRTRRAAAAAPGRGPRGRRTDGGAPEHGLTLAATPTALGSRALAALPAAGVTLRVLAREEIPAAVAEGGADLGLVDGLTAPNDPLRHPDVAPLTTYGVGEEPVSVLLPETHPLARRDGLRLADLVDARWLDAPGAGLPLAHLRRANGSGASARPCVTRAPTCAPSPPWPPPGTASPCCRGPWPPASRGGGRPARGAAPGAPDGTGARRVAARGRRGHGGQTSRTCLTVSLVRESSCAGAQGRARAGGGP